MNASFTNVQVYVGERSSEEVHAAVLEAIYYTALVGPFREMAGSDLWPDRTVVLAPPGPEPWIVVYDELIERADELLVAEYVRMLSAATDSYALGARVQDSDVLDLWLSRRGQLIDSYSSAPEEAERREPSLLMPRSGDVELWAPLLLPGVSPLELRRVWEQPTIFAEDILYSMALLLGMSPDYCLEGLDYLWMKPASLTLTSLNFCLRQPRARILEHAA